MLLGVAQVVVNVARLDLAAGALLADGYEPTFQEDTLPNQPDKAPLQSRPRERLAMAHYAGGERVAIELTAYEDGPPAGGVVYELRRPAEVVLNAGDVEASRALWTAGLGFEDAGEGRLHRSALQPSWTLDLLVRDAPALATPTTVDADGCVLITILTTSIDRDLERLRAAGHVLDSCGPWSERVAGRDLQVAMFRGPSGELVELLTP